MFLFLTVHFRNMRQAETCGTYSLVCFRLFYFHFILFTLLWCFVWIGLDWTGLVSFGLVWFPLVWFALLCFGLVCFGWLVVWFALFGLLCLVLIWFALFGLFCSVLCCSIRFCFVAFAFVFVGFAFVSAFSPYAAFACVYFWLYFAFGFDHSFAFSLTYFGFGLVWFWFGLVWIFLLWFGFFCFLARTLMLTITLY